MLKKNCYYTYEIMSGLIGELWSKKKKKTFFWKNQLK